MQTCPKMRYKVEFAPADLLCPKALLWIPFDRIKPYLDSQSGRALSEAPCALTKLGSDALPLHRQRHPSEAKVSCSALLLCFFQSQNLPSSYGAVSKGETRLYQLRGMAMIASLTEGY